VSRRLIYVVALTASFMVVEAVAGWVSGSLALLADAGHMLSDVGALSLSAFTAWLAQRPASPRRTYGYLRLEILAAMVNGVALFGIAVGVTLEALERVREPRPIQAGLFLVVALLGLAVNMVALRALHDLRHGSLNVRGAYLHVLGDALGSVAAVVAAVVVATTGWTVADPIVSIALSLLILIGAWQLVKESVNVLLEAAPVEVSLDEVRTRLLGVAGVADIHDLHVWTVTSGVVAMSGHAVVPDLADHPAALRRMLAEVETLGIHHATLQLEVQDHCEGLDCLRRDGAPGLHPGHTHVGHTHP
jgi:cobalt-zinc-cadmium efflux system protein